MNREQRKIAHRIHLLRGAMFRLNQIIKKYETEIDLLKTLKVKAGFDYKEEK